MREANCRTIRESVSYDYSQTVRNANNETNYIQWNRSGFVKYNLDGLQDGGTI